MAVLDGCPLTPGELETLEGVGRGLVPKQIAAERGVSPSTVRTHLTNVYRKLGVPDRAQAILAAQRAGWIKGGTSCSNQLLFDVRDALARLERRLPLRPGDARRLAEFERELARRDRERRPELNAMLDDLAAVLDYVGRYGTVPPRGAGRRPGRERDGSHRLV